MTDIFERTGRRVLHNGNTQFAPNVFGEGEADRFSQAGILTQNYRATADEVQGKVRARRYAVVLTEFDEPSFCDPDMLRENYEKVEQIDYYTYFGHSPVRVWRPRPRADAPAAAR